MAVASAGPYASLHLAPPRQITMPAPHHSKFFTGRMPFLPPNQQRQSTEGTKDKSTEDMAVNILLIGIMFALRSTTAHHPVRHRGGSRGRVTSHPLWRGSLFHVIIMRAT